MVGGGVLEHFAATRDPLDSRGWAQQMLRLPQELGIADRVAWTGGFPLESDRASLYLRAADACVLPFDQGIFLNNSSFAAAAAHGLPMLTTRGATLEPAFRHGENVFLCPPRDPELLAAAIETLLGDPDLCRRLGAGALRLAQEWFSWDKAIERTLAAFDSAPASGGAAG
jgi:glycosyltransferase involved in cell wall biosynthesis